MCASQVLLEVIFALPPTHRMTAYYLLQHSALDAGHVSSRTGALAFYLEHMGEVVRLYTYTEEEKKNVTFTLLFNSDPNTTPISNTIQI